MHLSKIGEIPIKLHRRVKGKIKGVIIKRTKSRKYAIFQVEEEPEPLLKTGRAVGIDLGVKHFAVDSDDNAFENPLFLEKSIGRIKRLQKRLSRKQKGSNNWEKARVKLAKAYEKLYNRRRDFLHKLALYYVRNYDVIVLEDLDAKNIVKNGSSQSFKRRFLDSALKEFVRILSDKAERAGRRVVFVEPACTSRTCSRCGFVVKELKLSDMVFVCSKCGLVLDRDLNASFNILKKGLGEGLGRPGLLVGGRPLPRVVPYLAVVTGQVFR